MGLLNHVDLEIDDYCTLLSCCLFFFLFFKAVLELGYMKMAGGHSGHEQLDTVGMNSLDTKSYHLSVFLLLQENSFSRPIRKRGEIPKLCSPALIKYNWLNVIVDKGLSVF